MVAHPRNRASEIALDIYSKVLSEVRADRLVNASVELAGDALFVQGSHIDLSAFARIMVCGAGKASATMARELESILGDRVSGGLVVTKRGHAEPLERVELLEATHPTPDESSVVAGELMLEFARELDSRDLVIFLLSGGASALMELPAGGLSLDDLVQSNKALLASGADISAVNAVRSRISRIKAGGLARAFAPATVICLVLSDVIGNDLQTIGSGPFVGRPAKVVSWPLLSRLPTSVQEHIEYSLEPPPTPRVAHFVVGSVSIAVQAAAAEAVRLGLVAMPFADPMRGEARQMSRTIGGLVRRAINADGRALCMVFGGETTVKIRGRGVGGRCQEMAVASLPWVTRIPSCCFLVAGTDGADGPTGVAGGIVDPDSYCRARDSGASLVQALSNNASQAYLSACDGLITTGPTGSNVNDIALFVHCP